MTCRNWLCTLNNPEDPGFEAYETLYKKLKANYLVGQVEKGESGTLHLQFFVNFKSPVRMSRITKVNKKVHCEQVKVNNGADTYCMKEDSRVDGPWEFGVRPVKVNNATDWERVRSLAKEGKYDDIPAEIVVKHYGNLSKLAKDNMDVQEIDHMHCEWFFGPTGAGKSWTARKECPPGGYYPKSVLNGVWFDGYRG